MKRSLLLSLFVFILIGCSKPLPELTGIDLSEWKDDPHGCKRLRERYLEAIKTQRDKLKGLSELDLVRLLGNPDQKDLRERQERFYYYYIFPGTKCSDGSMTATQLIIRFNATGVSREVAVE